MRRSCTFIAFAGLAVVHSFAPCLVEAQGGVAPLLRDTELHSVLSGGFIGNAFGDAFAIEATRIVVGSPQEGSGAAYVYEFDGTEWVRVARLVGGTRFGDAVALSGETIAVGEPNYAGVGPGAARVFVRAGTAWLTQAVLAAPVDLPVGGFGTAVALHGDVLFATGLRDHRRGTRGLGLRVHA